MANFLFWMAIGAWIPIPFFFFMSTVPPATWVWIGSITILAVLAKVLELVSS